jgi:hypothetical protein
MDGVSIILDTTSSADSSGRKLRSPPTCGGSATPSRNAARVGLPRAPAYPLAPSTTVHPGAPERPEAQRQRLYDVLGGPEIQDRSSTRGDRRVERCYAHAAEADDRIPEGNDRGAGTAEGQAGNDRSGGNEAVSLEGRSADAGGEAQVQDRTGDRAGSGRPARAPARGVIWTAPLRFQVKCLTARKYETDVARRQNDRPDRPPAAGRREARISSTVACAAVVSHAIAGPTLSQPVTGDRRGAIRAGSRGDDRVG